MNKSLLKNLHSPSNFLLMLAKQGLEPDLYGGRKQSLSFSILTRLNNNTVTIDTNQGQTIRCIQPSEFYQTIKQCQKQTKMELLVR